MTEAAGVPPQDLADTSLDAWRARVAARAPDWFPELRGAHVQVRAVRHDHRRLSSTMVLQVGTGDRWRRVVVKQGGRSDGLARPRRGPPEEALTKHESEWRALCLLERRVAGIEGLGAIRALEHVPQLRAIVMEWLDSTTLRHVVGPLPRGSWPADRPLLLHRAGQLVRILHELPSPADPDTTTDHQPPRLGTYLNFLARHGADRAILQRVGALADTVERRRTEGPVGLLHDDLAPRNVLVDRDGNVALIDMLARHRAPVAADLAGLRASLRLAMDPVRTPARRGRGAARWLQAEGHVLRGYLGTSATDADLRHLSRLVDVHEVVVLVDQWSALLAAHGAGAGPSARRRWKRHLVRAALGDAAARVEGLPGMP